MKVQQEYQPLQLEQPQEEQGLGAPHLSRKQWLAFWIAICIAGLASFVFVSKSLNYHKEHKLEVLSDDTPASKRGAGLLLT